MSFLIALAGVIVFFFLWFLFPEVVYDQFIWKYFWGPILSDGLGKSVSYNGVSAAPKFTIVSEITYGIVVAGALYGIYRLLKKWDITLDFSFFLGLFPFILYGSFARALEDTQLFTEPLVFWFVTPLIYIQALILTLLSLFLAVHLHRIRRLSKWSISRIVGCIGSLILLPFLYYILLWMTGSTWSDFDGLYPNVFLLVIILCIGITLAVYLIAKYVESFWKDAHVFSNPMNLCMIFGHQLDGIASYISIYDPLHMGLPVYIEKHPASNFLMQFWPPLFPIAKFFLIIGIIYVLDVLYKEELKTQKLFINLLKIGIFILGFAPGLRDLLRVMMGV
jgi:uncharacterized membrane protein